MKVRGSVILMREMRVMREKFKEKPGIMLKEYSIYFLANILGQKKIPSNKLENETLSS